MVKQGRFAALHNLLDLGRLRYDHGAMELNKIILEAIALQKCVLASYNRTAVKLAPHILYTRHDALFIDAVTLERDGQAPREKKLGSFRLTGLKDIALDDSRFQPEPLFDRNDPRYEGTALFAVEPESAQAA